MIPEKVFRTSVLTFVMMVGAIAGCTQTFHPAQYSDCKFNLIQEGQTIIAVTELIGMPIYVEVYESEGANLGKSLKVWTGQNVGDRKMEWINSGPKSVVILSYGAQKYPHIAYNRRDVWFKNEKVRRKVGERVTE